MNMTDVIRRPLITEKTSILREDGKTIVFHVAAGAMLLSILKMVLLPVLAGVAINQFWAAISGASSRCSRCFPSRPSR